MVLELSKGGHLDGLVSNVARSLVLLEFLAQDQLAYISVRVSVECHTAGDHEVFEWGLHALLGGKSTRFESLHYGHLQRLRCQLCIVLADAR